MRLAYAFLAGAGTAAILVGHGLAALGLLSGAPIIIVNVLIVVGLVGTILMASATLALTIEKLKKSGFALRRASTLRPVEDAGPVAVSVRIRR